MARPFCGDQVRRRLVFGANREGSAMRRLCLSAVAMAFCCLAAAPIPIEDPCTCASAMKDNGWCDRCEIGYVASIEVRSSILFEALDAHGHDIDPESASLRSCLGCEVALKNDGYCPQTRCGFVGRQAYFSRLTYLLARGEKRDLSKVACTVCTTNASDRTLPVKGRGWCDQCAVGMIGDVAFRDPKMFKAAAKQYELLLKAIKTSERCGTCAAAQFYGRRCPICRISYKTGEPVKMKAARATRP